MEKKLQKKNNLTEYYSLIVQDLLQAHYQILLKILLKKFIKINVNMNTMKKKVKLGELNINIARVQYADLEYDLIEHKCCSSNYQKILMENWKNNFLIHINYLTKISISLFCCCKKVFIHTNKWMIGKNSIIYH